LNTALRTNVSANNGGWIGARAGAAAAPPTVTSINPTSGPVGTVVTATGTDLGGTSAVSVNGTAATTILNDSATQVRYTIGVGTTTGTTALTATAGSVTGGPTFTVTTPPPPTTTTVNIGAVMSFIIRANETLLAGRSVPLFILNTDGTEHTASLANVKARISVNGATAVNSTADVSRVDGADCSLVLTTAEVAAFAVGDRVRIRVPASGARAMAAALVEVSADNVFAAADTAATIATAVDAIQLDNFAALPTAAQIATASVDRLAGADGLAARTAIWGTPARTLTAGAAPAAATIAAEVRLNLATELARLDAPMSGAITAATLAGPLTNLRQALGVGARFGGPAAGGTSAVVSVFDPGNSSVLLGSVIIYRDATGAVVGQSPLTPP
jgi:hypothetical protein